MDYLTDYLMTTHHQPGRVGHNNDIIVEWFGGQDVPPDIVPPSAE